MAHRSCSTNDVECERNNSGQILGAEMVSITGSARRKDSGTHNGGQMVE
jgi:hypothetical protein